MKNIREATVIMAKCRKSKQGFGIRVEKMEDKAWHCTWAFKLNAEAAGREGYGGTLVSGKFINDDEYPGCPYCEAKGWFSCGACGKLTCYDGETTVTCGWCGNTGETHAADNFDLKGDGY